jgi:hypothetical protein
VRRTGRKAEPPRNQVQGNGAQKSRQDHVRGDHAQVDEALPNGTGDAGPKSESRDEIEERRPDNSLKGREDPAGNDSCYGIGVVMKPVDEIKNESDGDDDDRQNENRLLSGHLARRQPNAKLRRISNSRSYES